MRSGGGALSTRGTNLDDDDDDDVENPIPKGSRNNLFCSILVSNDVSDIMSQYHKRHICHIGKFDKTARKNPNKVLL